MSKLDELRGQRGWPLSDVDPMVGYDPERVDITSVIQGWVPSGCECPNGSEPGYAAIIGPDGPLALTEWMEALERRADALRADAVFLVLRVNAIVKLAHAATEMAEATFPRGGGA